DRGGAEPPPDLDVVAALVRRAVAHLRCPLRSPYGKRGRGSGAVPGGKVILWTQRAPGTGVDAKRSGVAELGLELLGTLGRVGELLAVDRLGAVEPLQRVRRAVGREQRVGVGVAQPYHPGRTRLRVDRGELECPQCGVQLAAVA